MKAAPSFSIFSPSTLSKSLSRRKPKCFCPALFTNQQFNHDKSFSHQSFQSILNIKSSLGGQSLSVILPIQSSPHSRNSFVNPHNHPSPRFHTHNPLQHFSSSPPCSHDFSTLRSLTYRQSLLQAQPSLPTSQKPHPKTSSPPQKLPPSGSSLLISKHKNHLRQNPHRIAKPESILQIWLQPAEMCLPGRRRRQRRN